MEWLWLISLAIAIVFAVLCYRIAEGKGRSGVLWGILGFIIPIIALIIILVLPDKSTATA
jgi:predicted cobalt transporter CbtA